MTPAALRTAWESDPGAFTPWFGVVLDRMRAWLADEPAGLPSAVREAWRT
jgi:hypothetical protein